MRCLHFAHVGAVVRAAEYSREILPYRITNAARSARFPGCPVASALRESDGRFCVVNPSSERMAQALVG